MPRAVFWYSVYCHAVAVFNLGLLAISLWFVTKSQALANEYVSSQTVFVAGLVCAPLALFLVIGNLWLVRARTLKDPWAFHMTNIVVGIGTCVLAPLAVPLLIAWFQPSVREWYARDVSRP